MMTNYKLHNELNDLQKELSNIRSIQDNLINKHLEYGYVTYATHKKTGIVYDREWLEQRTYAIQERMSEVRFEIDMIDK